jgi:hypothetical protein
MMSTSEVEVQGSRMTLTKWSRLLVVAVILGIAACAWWPPLQALANEQVDAGTKRALVSFASARTLNAVISVVQGTEVAVQPMGVGITLTLGQALDPINDLVEQFSSLMLVASVAFGVQKVLLAIGGHWAISAIVTALAAVWAVLYFVGRAPSWLSRLLAVVLLIRFAIPVATLGSDWVFQQFLAQDYQEQQSTLDSASREIAQKMPAKPPNTAQDKSWWDRLKDRAGEVVANPSANLEAIKTKADELPERVLKLIVIFLLQTMVIPIVLVWVLYRVALDSLGPARVGR